MRKTEKERTMSEISRGAGVLLIDQRGWVLLQLRDAQAIYPFHWGSVGGGVEPGESDEEGARRELFEETGYRVGALALGGRTQIRLPDGSERVVTLFYAPYDGLQPIGCYEGERIEFVDPAHLPKLTFYVGQRELVRETLAKAHEAWG